MDNALESFINYCDRMQIANESKVISIKQSKIGGSNYNNYILNLKIDGANIAYYVKTANIMNDDEDMITVKSSQDKQYSVSEGVDEAFNAMKKEFNKIKISMAEDIFAYMQKCVKNGDINMQKRIDQYKDPRGLSHAIKPQGNIIYEYYPKYKIGQFSLTYDTNPYIDNNHCYTKIVEYYFDTKKLNYSDSEYDG